MVYDNPYITGLSTFDLSARETSRTTDQHLGDSRALTWAKNSCETYCVVYVV